MGVAQTDAQGQWHLLGVLPLFDAPREDSQATIAAAKQTGVEIKMITGDQVAIATEIAVRLGLGTHILDAKLLSDTTPIN